MPDLVPVRVRDCACPDSPHADEGDLVYLRPMLGLEGGILAEQQLRDSGGDQNLVTRLWLRTFVEHGAVDWNLTDAEGESVPFDVEVILDDWRLARPVGDTAADLYADAILDPFREASPKKSLTGRTRRGTSATPEPTSGSPDSP